MIPHKEELIKFEQLARQQGQVYDDAADYGIVIKRGLSEMFSLAELRTDMKALVKFYKPAHIAKPTYHRWTFAIPYEVDEGIAKGTQMVVEWHLDRIRKVEFLTIELHPKTWVKGHYPPCMWSKK